MKKESRRRFRKFATAFLAGILFIPGLFTLADSIELPALAESGNTVYFFNTSINRNSNIIYNDIVVRGTPNDVVKVTYKTIDVNAISGIDYVGINNTVSIKIGSSGATTYSISVKCLNDSNSRQVVQTCENYKNPYGRYFEIKIVSAENATINTAKDTCKCYLPYTTGGIAVTKVNDGEKDPYTGRSTAYISEYAEVLTDVYGGTDDIDGKETWKSWNNWDLSIDCTQTDKWVTSFINTGLADVYGSVMMSSIDDATWQSSNDIDVLVGNKQFMSNYSRSKDCPGLFLYFTVNPDKKGGYLLNNKAMYWISQKVDPTSKEDKLVNVDDFYKIGDYKRLYFIQSENMWYASKNTLYDLTFYKTEPYQGAIDLGVAVYNSNSSCDREIHNVTILTKLYDSKAPTLKNTYAKYDEDTGKIRFYLRFSEPVYSSKGDSIRVKINNSGTPRTAEFKGGNYTDTLVYELPIETTIEGPFPHVNIEKFSVELSDDDICDLAYILDASRNISNNLLVASEGTFLPTTIVGGHIDLTKPHLSIDLAKSLQARNIYNLTLSANNGDNYFNEGIVYYKWDKNDDIANPDDPASYDEGHILTSEEKGSFFLTLVKNESKGIDSGKYYLHALAVSPYGYIDAETFGPYNLDGDNPVLEQLTPEPNTLRTKTFKLAINQKEPGAATVKNVTLNAKYKQSNGAETVSSLPIVANGDVISTLTSYVSITEDTENKKDIYSVISNIDETSPIDSFITDIMGESPRTEIEIYFNVEDTAGNKSTSNSTRAVYDNRTLFSVNINVPDAYVEDTTVSEITDSVYNISTVTSEDGITYSIPNDEEGQATRAYIDDGAVFSVLVNNQEVEDSDSDPYSFKVAGLGPGHYDCVCRVSGPAGDLVSNTTSFYLTNNFTDITENKEKANGDLVLSNKVYELEDVDYYYFDNDTLSIISHPYGATLNPSNGRYEGGSSSPAFSSAVEAKKYIKYMEYQDMTLIAVTDVMASVLNTGVGSTLYVKAAGETKTAQEGQLWIRYKRNIWTPGSESSGWAFYYYGEGNLEDGINVYDLSSNLSSAIDAVTTRIVGGGVDTYLVTEDTLNQSTGAPYLATSQMHPYMESVSTSKSGTPYVSDLVFNGDSTIYTNTVQHNNETYPLATNMPLTVTDSSSIFYKYGEEDKWHPTNAKDGQLLKDVLPSSGVTGVYTIREYSDKGVSQFLVYVDKSRPTVHVTLDSESEGFNLDDSISQITCRSLTIDSMSGEDDSQAYVAIYSYPYKKLEAVLYGEAVNGYVLSDGNYYLQIGDRSGNIATYTVLTSNTNIDLSVEENEGKTGVYVKVNNRNDNEIYSYEVYVNEVLFDSEFANTKFYREPGMYRVVVTDIYGNTETALVAHTAPSPEITWYYLNDNESYSQYNPEKPVKMVLEDDEFNPRVTYVYTSTLLKLAFNEISYDTSTVGYELLDIEPSQYFYNAGSGLLTINTMTSWRLKVWYTSNPEDDHEYICIVDNEAPNCSGSFIGTSFEQVVVYDDDGKVIETSTFDFIDFEKYQKGDVVTLDTLDYINNGIATLTFENGSVISGSHIMIGLNDQSGIKYYTVTRNGTNVEVELDSEGRLILNDYGEYVITVADNLDNISVFRFTNVEDDGAIAQIDDNIINVFEKTYGHDNIVVTALYNGKQTILVKTPHGDFTYEFNFDGHTMTYGHYIVTEEEYEGDEGIEVIKTAGYEQNIGFALNIYDVKTNNWYPVIQAEDYAIYAAFDDDFHALYKVESIQDEITVETSLYHGNAKLPDHFIAVLSREQAEVSFLTGGEEVITTPESDIIYITNDLTIDPNTDLTNIMTIQFGYNAVTPSFYEEDYQTIYEYGEYCMDFVGTENGFYRIIVTNKYHNQTVYLVSKITSFASNVVIQVLDGSVVTYYDVDGPVYSNHIIDLLVYSDNVYFEVNGVTTSGIVERGVTTLELDKDGYYNVRVIGENGIFEDFVFEIKNDETFLYKDEWITGYNEEALLYEQGYTNQKCDINVDEDVIFIDYVFNDDIYVKLYDTITDDPMIEPELLKGAVGALGPGKYEVGFRNKYGDLIQHTVYFSDVPSLNLERIVTTDPDVHQPYSLDLAMEYGFYSNYVLIFSTDSSNYVFKINDEEYRLDEPKTIEFTNASGKGSFSYLVDYLDEYGNHISFQAILYRYDVEIDTSSMKTVILNNTEYTRNDVSITFQEGLFATVSVDEGNEKEYLSGEVFYGDGSYRFVVEDRAGNQAIYTIVHKSVNHYTLTTGNNDSPVILGGVVNNTSVVFKSTDGSKITQVVRDGELMAEYESNNFNTTGHWELLIEDSIGNISYEEFYIINNELARFDYPAPYGYTITEVWRIANDGTRQLLPSMVGPSISLTSNGDYIVVVTSKDTTSTFNFSVSINDNPPTATLVGVENGGVTARDITLSGLKSGDVVKVYKDGELLSTTVVTLSTEGPSINTGGRYRVVVTNIAGVTTEYQFTRKAITNVAGSVFVIVTCALLITGIGVGLLYHTRLKTDD